MTISFSCELECEIAVPYQEIMTEVVDVVLDYEDCPYETEVNVAITNDEGIRRINKEYRGIDKATDVLSFPMIEYDMPSDFDWLEDYGEYFNPETGELILGDIMVSIEHVWAQAQEYGHSVERELAFLSVHSMLHLCGYDHIEEQDREVMEEKQREIMNLLGITRE